MTGMEVKQRDMKLPLQVRYIPTSFIIMAVVPLSHYVYGQWSKTQFQEDMEIRIICGP